MYNTGNGCCNAKFALKGMGAMTSDTSSSASFMYFSALHREGVRCGGNNISSSCIKLKTRWLYISATKYDEWI